VGKPNNALPVAEIAGLYPNDIRFYSYCTGPNRTLAEEKAPPAISDERQPLSKTLTRLNKRSVRTEKLRCKATRHDCKRGRHFRHNDFMIDDRPSYAGARAFLLRL
jgi:hypothetical protein